jgi:hypothetical protein
MNHDFFSMTLKLSANPCIGRAPGHQGKEGTEEQVKFQSNDDHLFDSGGTVHIDWVPEGETVNQVMKKLSEKDLQHCFQQWRICMERCRGWRGHHLEGDNISIEYQILQHQFSYFIATPHTLNKLHEDWQRCLQNIKVLPQKSERL